ncbi:retrotransposon protein, putative, ty1-copia subclass [Tanacetum coccineum]|uniref:Retrotransposon protein, putative, ty1-copia subclass n=1 Tax=Tanacetum coccineum TaxID=301880 RepID=A0ABQ4ZN34_9ASTR
MLASRPPPLLRLVVGGIVGRIVVGNYRVVVEKFGYIIFVVEVAIVEMKFDDLGLEYGLLLGDHMCRCHSRPKCLSIAIKKTPYSSKMERVYLSIYAPICGRESKALFRKVTWFEDEEIPKWLTYDFPPAVKAKVNRLWGGGEWHGQAQKWFLMKLTKDESEINLASGEMDPEFSEWKLLENMTTSVGNNSVFRSFFEKQKFTGPNFIDWYRQLWLALSTEDKEKYLEQPIPTSHVAAAPDQPIPPAALATYNEWVKNQKEIFVMIQELKELKAHLGANDMLKELKALYSKQAEQELLQTMREFHTCKQEEGQSVSSLVLKMKSYIDQLEHLGHPITLNLGVSLILVRLSKEYDSFVQNYNMHSMGKTVNELHAMLKLHEEILPKKVVAPMLHAIRSGKVWKNKNKKPSKAAKGVHRKGKGKMAYANAAPSYAPKPKNPPSAKKDNPAKDAICHHCDEGLRGSKKLNLGALSLYMGNGQRAAVEAIGNYHLCLPSGLVIVLNNCHYAPSITRGIILVSRLYDDGFINHFELNNAISISKNNMVYFSAIPKEDVYEIEMSCSNTNDSSMYVVSNKRAKLNLDSSLLWHCHLGHINKKCIKKLQHDGLFNSTDIESLGKCVSCMSGNMARKPYSHQVERAKDLIGLIHIDVSGPLRIVSRQGANYFVTFTDDFSRYGYVYLLKHKHEVFETFKVFQKEVENQLGKTIKSLRSDREGEYMSQEFLDHLKEHGIIAHCAPPYTPQYNGVLERRNRTLLDMVHSMMSQTTLQKSFWDYAHESAAHILNMVPTKKVDKTPYEIWHGQAPKLSYLKVWGCEALVKRDTLTKHDKLEPRSFKCIFVVYPKETMGYSFYNPSENKVFVARNAEFFESNLIDQEASGSLEDLEIIQEEDTNPSLDTSLNHEDDDQEINEPQSDINPIRRSSRTKRAPDRMCLYINAEEHELGDLREPANYKAALLDLESEK